MEKSISTQDSKVARICNNCFFSIYAGGRPRPVLMCKQRTGSVGRWLLCKPVDSCDCFYPSSASSESTRLIPLTRGKAALVDADEYSRQSLHRWSTATGHNTCYAVRGHKGRIIRMHRVILNAPDDMVVDHINHNGLDNRRANLRLCTQTQNSANCRPQTNRSSKYKGVVYFKRDDLYYAKIRRDGNRIHIGSFKNEIDAAVAYDRKAKELFGEFAYLNFPNV